MEETGFHKRMKTAMEARKMRQSELADITGIDKSQISCYLSGKYHPKQENLNLIANALQVDVYWLIGTDIPLESGESISQSCQGQRIKAYAERIYMDRESETVLKAYAELSVENRKRVRDYMEKVLKVQRLEEEIDRQ